MPAWMRVSSPIEQAASTHPPPIPIQLEEYSASPGLCGVAVGTVHAPATALKSLFPRSIDPWLYPDQLLDWFAPSVMMGRWNRAGGVAAREAAGRTARTVSV